MRLPLMLLILLPSSSLVAQSWRVDPKPITAIGASDLSGSELLKVTSARRLSDGRVVVTNGDPREVRIFGKDGKLLSRFGRAGKGPGEFGYAIELLPAGGDSILIWDLGHRRKMLFQPDGKLLSEALDPTGSVALGQAGIFKRTLARMRPNEDNSCIRMAIASLPPAPFPALRELFADEGWRIWTRDKGGVVWALHTVSGKSLGTITLPTGMEILEAGKDFVLGRTTDADGFDHVQLLRATLPPAQTVPRPCPVAAQDSMPVSKLVSASIKTDMRNGMTAFEAYFADHGKYPASFNDLKGFPFSDPDAVTPMVSMAGAGGFVFAIFHRKTTFMCAVAVGDGIPAGWPNGALMCGW